MLVSGTPPTLGEFQEDTTITLAMSLPLSSLRLHSSPKIRLASGTTTGINYTYKDGGGRRWAPEAEPYG